MRLKAWALVALCASSLVYAGPREQARRLHNRLTGVPPTTTTENQMITLIQAGNAEAAAELAMQNPRFYDVTLKNWFKVWTNQEETNRVPLNDMVATAIGIVRDDIGFDQVLYGDHLYVSNAGNAPAYAVDNNDHYEYLEDNRVSLATTLQRVNQSNTTGISETAGVLTTRASGAAFLSAGTNRRITRFTFMNFLCRDFEALHDITIPDVWVRRDVDRAPGGDSRAFKNKCVGCHAGQDALGGAFAYFNWDGDKVTYTNGTVQEKINANILFTDGHVVSDDSWQNLWATGQNAALGWRGVQSGTGPASFGRMLTSSKAFSQCMAQKSFKLVCLKEPQSATDIAAVASMADSFEAGNNYSLKDLIAKTSTLCMGQ
jgi:prepilin-type processing-associated H-X9-DG protein